MQMLHYVSSIWEEAIRELIHIIIVCFIRNNPTENKHFQESMISFYFLLTYRAAKIRGPSMTYSNIE
jgi:hypothetical protein